LRTILNWLAHRNNVGKKPTLTRLSSAEAIELAKQAAAQDPLGPILSLATVQNRSGQLIWSVSAPVLGRTLEVEVDDQTSRILAMHHRGVR
jgi:hypothetical protein